MALLLAGCSAAPAPVASTQPTATATPPADSAGPVPTASVLPDPVASPMVKVSRPGVTTTATVSATPSTFGGTVTYPDRVVLAMTRVSRGVETGHGPGAFPGRAYVAVDLRLTNGSRSAVDLGSVVLTAYSGPTRQRAAAVYAAEAQVADFSGVLAPGRSATARYAFALPTTDATLVCDFDALHTSAVFQGAVKAS